MIQPHQQEEAWESKRFREAEEKKLFTLHCENERLAAKQYEFQGVIADYAHKIDTFGQKTKKLEEENRELKAEVEKLTSKHAKVEDALNKRNEQYCSLYNYLFTEKRGTLQDAFLKEVDLSNRLNQIQHESDAQIISKLKDNIKKKNEDLLRQTQRIVQLEGNLMNSAYEYQEKINILKVENERLQKRPNIPESTLPALDDIREYCLNKKISALQEELKLYESQLQISKKELSTLKKGYSSLERQKLSLDTELKLIKNHISTFDGSIYSILQQNITLKNRLESQILRSQQLQRSYPQFVSRSQELNNFLNVKQVEAKLNQKITSLNDQKQSLKKEVQALTKQSKASLQAQLNAEKKYESLKLVSTSAFQKLMDVIATYVPYYFRRSGLENYNLDKEEQQFIAQRNVEKTLQAAYQEINKKTAEAHQYKLKQTDAEQKITKQEERIRLLQRELSRKEEEITKLSESVEALTEAKKSHDCSHNNRYGFQAYEQDEDLNQIANEDGEYLSRIPPENEPLEKGYQIKIQILEKGIQELQEDRSELINIIKSNEVLIAQLSAEVKALSSTSHIRHVSIQPTTFTEAKPTFIESYQQENIDDQGEYLNRNQIDEIREQLRQISTEHRLEKQLLIKEFEQKEAQSHGKYLSLLNHYNELASKCITLEAAANSHNAPQPNNQDLNQSAQSEIPLQVPEAQHQPQKDQPTISESAIETFTDTLKKYEKEFNRFVGIYQAQIKKSMESSMISQMVHESEGESQIHPDDQLENMQTILNQHHDTIKHLESLLEEKDRQAQLQVAQLEEQLREQKQSAETMSKRLQDAETTIVELKDQLLSSKSGAEFSSSESANAAFLILNAKNKQVDELKSALQKLRKVNEEKTREQAKLRDLGDSHSQIQAQEYRIFREIMEQQNLVGVLQAVAKRLA